MSSTTEPTTGAKWDTLEAMVQQDRTQTARDELAAMKAAAGQIAAQVQKIEHENEHLTMAKAADGPSISCPPLVRCNGCRRTTLAQRFAAHLATCPAATAPLSSKTVVWPLVTKL